jgi:hypothetical protein
VNDAVESPFATRNERAANIAVRETVEERGDEAPRALYQHFDMLQVQYFQNELKPALILLTTPSSPSTYGDYMDEDEHGLRSRIRIRPSLVRHASDPDNVFAKDVLLHEMVHAWQHEVALEPEGGYRGHGPVFAAKCNEIGRKLGLPDVFVRSKKNKGKPLCNQWPHCVRPAGYYPGKQPRDSAAEASSNNGSGTDSGSMVAIPRAQWDDLTQRIRRMRDWCAEPLQDLEDYLALDDAAHAVRCERGDPPPGVNTIQYEMLEAVSEVVTAAAAIQCEATPR